MEKQKKAKYFCENCGSEVAAKAKFCPKCGKFFSSVRCPECAYTGDVKEFIHGCPQCGYAVPKNISNNSSETSDGLKHKLSLRKKQQIKNSFAAYEAKSSDRNKQNVSGDVPLWLFAVCIVVLGGIIYALIGNM